MSAALSSFFEDATTVSSNVAAFAEIFFDVVVVINATHSPVNVTTLAENFLDVVVVKNTTKASENVTTFAENFLDLDVVINATNSSVNVTTVAEPSLNLVANETVPSCTPVNWTAVLSSLPDDDPLDPISTETLTLFTNWKSTVIVHILVIFGVPTNALNLVVFFKLGLKQRINSCLFCLSLVDILYLLFMFFTYLDGFSAGSMTQTTPEMYRPLGPAMHFMFRHGSFGFYGLAWASMFVSAVVACERCVTVTWPLRSATIMRPSSTRVILFIGVFLVTGGFFVVGKRVTVNCVLNVESGEEEFLPGLSEFYLNNSGVIDFLDFVVYGSVIPFVTVGGVTVMTIITVVKLAQAVKFRQSASSSASTSSTSTGTIPPPEVALTKMLVLLSLQFILLQVPNVTYRVAKICYSEIDLLRRMGNLHVFGYGVLEICMCVSASTNVFVYYLAGSKYRATVRKLVKCCSFRKQARPSQFALSSVGGTENTDDVISSK